MQGGGSFIYLFFYFILFLQASIFPFLNNTCPAFVDLLFVLSIHFQYVLKLF